MCLVALAVVTALEMTLDLGVIPSLATLVSLLVGLVVTCLAGSTVVTAFETLLYSRVDSLMTVLVGAVVGSVVACVVGSTVVTALEMTLYPRVDSWITILADSVVGLGVVCLVASAVVTALDRPLDCIMLVVYTSTEYRANTFQIIIGKARVLLISKHEMLWYTDSAVAARQTILSTRSAVMRRSMYSPQLFDDRRNCWIRRLLVSATKIFPKLSKLRARGDDS